MESTLESIPGLIETVKGKRYEYRSWKIEKLDDGSYQAVRIHPTKFFRASVSLKEVCKSIDRREQNHELLRLSILRQTID